MQLLQLHNLCRLLQLRPRAFAREDLLRHRGSGVESQRPRRECGSLVVEIVQNAGCGEGQKRQMCRCAIPFLMYSNTLAITDSFQNYFIGSSRLFDIPTIFLNSALR